MITGEQILMEKMRVLNRLSDAIEEARRKFVENPTAHTALQMQRLKLQRDAIRRTLPKIREVA